MRTRPILILAALVLVGSGAAASTPSSEPAVTPSGAQGPVYVDATEILYLESFPVQVRLLVQGSVPTPCHQPVWDVEASSERIEVRLWSVSDPDAVCVDVLDPFEIMIDLGSFESADLPLELNGEEIGRVQVGWVAPSPDQTTRVPGSSLGTTSM